LLGRELQKDYLSQQLDFLKKRFYLLKDIYNKKLF